MENKISNLKQELAELLWSFNSKNNRYSNPDFFKTIGFIGPTGLDVDAAVRKLAGGVGAASGNLNKLIPFIGGFIGTIEKSVVDAVRKELEMKQKNEKFNVYLQRLIAEKDFSNSDVRERANIDKSYFYQIIRGEKTPSRDRIIQIAIALNLNIEETNKLLGMQGYVLYGENPRDFVILFCIENKLDLINVNHMLDEFKEKPLSSVS